MKHAALAAVALVVLALFPNLPHQIVTMLAPALMWLSAQPLLVGFTLGAAAWPHLRRTVKTAAPAGK
jgi:hypothetical protein